MYSYYCQCSLPLTDGFLLILFNPIYLAWKKKFKFICTSKYDLLYAFCSILFLAIRDLVKHSLKFRVKFPFFSFFGRGRDDC